VNFKSKFESDVYEKVLKNGYTAEYETVKLPYSTHHNYVPDFTLSNGIIIECKGYFDIRAQVKMRAVKKNHPELDIRFVFMDSRKKIRKGSQTTYAEWCQRYGFPYTDGAIPVDWLKE
jgi:Phage endonuclease I